MLLGDGGLGDPGQFTRDDFDVNPVGDGDLRMKASISSRLKLPTLSDSALMLKAEPPVMISWLLV